MTPYQQLFRHLEDGVAPGDCWRTCLGCLLDLPPLEVPHFVQIAGWENNTECTRLTKEWLKEKGFYLFEVAFTGELQGILNYMEAVNPGIYYTLGGNSANHTGHSVICLNDKIVHDPGIDAPGIVGPMDDGYFWIGALLSKEMVA